MKFDHKCCFLLKMVRNRHKQATILLKTMDKEYEKEGFETLKIKTSVAKKFRKFSKILSKSQSMTLLLMLDFFIENGISPLETLGPRMETLEQKISGLIKKRMNGMIAIMKNIEKTQTMPTVAMMQSLFEVTNPPEQKLLREKKYLNEKPPVRFKEKNRDNSNDDI